MNLPLPALVLLAPLTAFAVVALYPSLRHRGAAAGLAVVTGSAVSLLAGVMMLVGQQGLERPIAHQVWRWMPSAGQDLAQVGWLVDSTSAPMVVVVGLVALCVQVYSFSYLHDEPGPSLGRYYAWHALFVVAMQILVMAPNLMQAFIGWELVGLCSYLLIGYWWKEAHVGKAAVKAFWVNKVADGGLLLGLIVLAGATGSFDWDPAKLDPSLLTAVTLLMFVGVMGKSAQVPLHVWLPDAMAGPTPVSALLHAATMVAAGVFLVVRAWPLFEGAETTLMIMCWFGGVTAFAAACFALVEDDVKKMLAFSTCSQLGYMVAALGSGAMVAGYFHLTTHAMFKALLFLGAGSLIHAVGTNDMSKMGGLRKQMPGTFVLFTIGCLALAGIPPLAGFFSKDLVLEGLLHGEQYGPLALCLAGVVLTAVYSGRAVVKIFFGELRSSDAHPHESPAPMMAPMVVLGVATVVVGFMGTQFSTLVNGTTDGAFHVAPVGIAGLVLALVGLGIGKWLADGGNISQLKGLGEYIFSSPLDRFYETIWRRVLLVGAGGLAWFDRYVVDGLMNLVGWGAIVGAERARKLQTGHVTDYVAALVVGVVVLVLSTAGGL
jgi:NADH-quinone oxidoreductase subunit L